MKENNLNGRGFNDWNKNVDNFAYNKRANEIDGEYITSKEKNNNDKNFAEINNKVNNKNDGDNVEISVKNDNNSFSNDDNSSTKTEASDGYKKSKYEIIAEQIIADLEKQNEEKSNEYKTQKELGEGIFNKRKTDFPMLISIFVTHCILFVLAILMLFLKLNASETGKAIIGNFLSIFLVLVYMCLFIVELFLMLRCQKSAGKVLFFVSLALIFPTVGILIP